MRVGVGGAERTSEQRLELLGVGRPPQLGTLPRSARRRRPGNRCRRRRSARFPLTGLPARCGEAAAILAPCLPPEACASAGRRGPSAVAGDLAHHGVASAWPPTDGRPTPPGRPLGRVVVLLRAPGRRPGHDARLRRGHRLPLARRRTARARRRRARPGARSRSTTRHPRVELRAGRHPRPPDFGDRALRPDPQLLLGRARRPRRAATAAATQPDGDLEAMAILREVLAPERPDDHDDPRRPRPRLRAAAPDLRRASACRACWTATPSTRSSTGARTAVPGRRRERETALATEGSAVVLLARACSCSPAS